MDVNGWDCENGILLFVFVVLSKMCKVEQLDEALRAVILMYQQGMPVSREVTYHFAHGCSKTKDLATGRQLHSLMVSTGLDTVAMLGDHLIRLFASGGSLLEAALVFCRIFEPSTFTWHAVISAHSIRRKRERALELYQQMQEGGISPDKVTFLCILRACCSLGALGQVHEQIIRSGLGADLVIGNTLIDMYAKCADLENAYTVFDSLPNRDVVSWTVMIAGYAQHGFYVPAVDLYERMQWAGIKADKIVCSSILKVCGNLGAQMQGKLIHGEFIRSGLELDMVIANTLVDMYAKCGSLKEALKVFDAMSTRDVASWTAMISGYAQHGYGFLALELFKKMLCEGIKPDTITFLCTLKACVIIGATEQGKLLHKQIIENGFESDLVVGNTLIDMYIKGGNVEDACKLFNKLQIQDLVSWNAIIAGYAEQGHGAAAIELYDRMQQTGIKPNKVTILCILKLCSNIGALVQSRLLHDQILRISLESDVMVGSTLIDLHIKCGKLAEAKKVFDHLPDRDAGSWGALIAGYAQQGHCKLAALYLMAMQRQGLKPLDRTFTSILTACSHAGLLKEGHWFFRSMQGDHGITPKLEHFNCMIDLLGRAGFLTDAEELLEGMPIPPDATGWMSLLAACKTYNNTDVGRRCFDQVVRLDPDIAAGYALMSSIYTESHMWEHVLEIEEMRKCACAWKVPGKAQVEVNSNILEFIVGEKHINHLQSEIVYLKLRRLRRFMEHAGYAPQVDLVFDTLLDEM